MTQDDFVESNEATSLDYIIYFPPITGSRDKASELLQEIPEKGIDYVKQEVLSLGEGWSIEEMTNEKNITHESIEIRHADQLAIRVLNFCINKNVSVCQYSLERTGGVIELKCHYERSKNANSSNIVKIIREILVIQEDFSSTNSA